MAKNFKTILIATFVVGLALTSVSGLQYALARLDNPTPVNTAGFLRSPVGDADVVDTITASNYLPLSGGTLTGALAGTTASWSAGLEVSGNKTFGINAGALTNTNFEVGGTASVSGAITLYSTVDIGTDGAGVRFSGADGVITLLGQGNGNDENLTIDFDNGAANVIVLGTGTSANTIDFAGLGIDLDSSYLKLPLSTVPTTSGYISYHEASESADFGDGAATRVVQTETCFSYLYEDPTTATQWPGKRFLDPFTLTKIGVVASGGNGVGWDLYYGPPNTAFGSLTRVFPAGHSASNSSSPTYKSTGLGAFTNFTLLDGHQLDLVIASKSATIGNLNLNICGYYNH